MPRVRVDDRLKRHARVMQLSYRGEGVEPARKVVFLRESSSELCKTAMGVGAHISNCVVRSCFNESRQSARLH